MNQNKVRLVPRIKKQGRGWWVVWALIMVAWGGHEFVIHRDVVRWEQYEKAAAAKGEDLGVDAWAPPGIANDADNFARHPLVEQLWSSAISPAAKKLEVMKPLVAGLSAKDELPDAVQAAKLLEDLRPVAGMLADLHTATLRSGCRLPFDPAEIFAPGFDEHAAGFGMLGRLLAAHARASLVCGDQEAAVLDVETLLHGSAHFRSQRLLLLGILAYSWEKSALEVIGSGLGKHQWSAESKSRLTAAFTGSDWPQTLCNILRLERGVYLNSYDHFPSSFRQMTAFRRVLFRLRYPVRREVPVNKRILCESLDPFLASGGTDASIEPMLQAAGKNRTEGPSSGIWAGVSLTRYGAVFRSVLDMDGSAKKIMQDLAAPDAG